MPKGLSEREKAALRKRCIAAVKAGPLPFLHRDEAADRCAELMKPGRPYDGFCVQPPSDMSAELHDDLAAAFVALKKHRYLTRHIVSFKDNKMSQTAVRRVLVGEFGTTHKYLGLRLFAVSWSGWKASDWGAGWDGDNAGGKAAPPREELERALSAFDRVNKRYVATTRSLLKARGWLRPEEPGESPHEFNISLLNFFDQVDDAKHTTAEDDFGAVKPEPWYGMGDMAVSWHTDKYLKPNSAVAVYNHSCADVATAAPPKAPAPDDVAGAEAELEAHPRAPPSPRPVRDAAAAAAKMAGAAAKAAGGAVRKWCVAVKVAWDMSTPAMVVPLQDRESPSDSFHSRFAT